MKRRLLGGSGRHQNVLGQWRVSFSIAIKTVKFTSHIFPLIKTSKYKIATTQQK
jgi:hypothetical protein